MHHSFVGGSNQILVKMTDKSNAILSSLDISNIKKS